MADVRESFPTLEGASQEGLALRAVQEGDSPSAINGSLGFAFKDDAGNAVLPQLNASGELPVVGPLTDTELRASPVPVSFSTPVPVTFTTVTGDGKRARGTASGNASLVTVASLTLAVNKIYENLDAVVSCFRDALFQVILSDNGSETIVAEALCGPGQLTSNIKMQEAEFATGATGTQLLLIKAQNLNALSDFRAALSVKLTN
jgi:hypothetical protein